MDPNKEKRAALIAQARAIYDFAKAENRDATAEEVRRFDALMDQAEKLPTSSPIYKPGMELGDRRDGEVRMLRAEERMAERHPNTEGLRLGAIVKGLATGDWKHAEAERRAMSESPSSAGGYMVPTPVAASVIDLARSRTCVLQAGARTVEMESSTLSLPRLTGDIPASWKAELGAASTGSQAFDRVLLTARTLYALAPISLELFDDLEDTLGTEIENALAKVFAIEIDRAALRGDGTGASPTGLLHGTSVPQQDVGANGASPTYDQFSQAVDTIRGANIEPGAVIYAPRTAGELDRLKDSQSRYLQPPQSFQALKKFQTTIVPTNLAHGTASTASEAYVGDFSNLVVGMRSDFRLEILREGFDGSVSGAQHGAVFVRAYLRADIGILRPSAFVVMTGLL